MYTKTGFCSSGELCSWFRGQSSVSITDLPAIFLCLCSPEISILYSGKLSREKTFANFVVLRKLSP